MSNHQNFSPESKIWIYQADRLLTEQESNLVAEKTAGFAAQWISHNRDLKASGECVHQLFIVLMVDESMAGASGCSIDKSVRFVQSLESELGVSFFNRLNFTYLDSDKNIHIAMKQHFKTLFLEKNIDEDTLVFDTLVKNKEEFDNFFIKPLRDSWHKRMVL
jgi:hypothetical protein